jgi:regulator of cell morphogenesis and NO signaling
MKHQDILGSCQQTTVSQLAQRYPETVPVFRQYLPELDNVQALTVRAAAAQADIEPKRLCQALFDKVMEQTPIDDLDTDVLLELILRGYDTGHLARLSVLHRLARKIEAVHRTNPDVPKGITLAIKKLEQTFADHIERESCHVLKRMEHDQPPMPDTPIAQMKEEHSVIRRQLRKLRSMTLNYQAPQTACSSWKRFYQELRDLDFSMREQIFLEQDVLFLRFQF